VSCLNKYQSPLEISLILTIVSAGIGLGPNGLRAMDLIEPEFRTRYEKMCVGNKSADAQNVFFEGLLLKEGLGMLNDTAASVLDHAHHRSQAKINHGTATRVGVILTSTVNRFVSLELL
jgi:hypothetical protein